MLYDFILKNEEIRLANFSEEFNFDSYQEDKHIKDIFKDLGFNSTIYNHGHYPELYDILISNTNSNFIISNIDFDGYNSGEYILDEKFSKKCGVKKPCMTQNIIIVSDDGKIEKSIQIKYTYKKSEYRFKIDIKETEIDTKDIEINYSAIENRRNYLNEELNKLKHRENLMNNIKF